MFIEYPKWLHHPEGEHPSQIVRDETEESALLEKWGVLKKEIEIAADSIRDKLLKRAEALALKVDARWSDKRLQTEVEKAESA